MTTQQMETRTKLLGYFHAINNRKYCNPFENIPDNKKSYRAYQEGYKSGTNDIQTIKIISNK